MRKTGKYNILKLAVFHLVLIIYPLAGKTLHVHHEGYPKHFRIESVSFDLPEDHCPVCHFEFFQFISSDVIHSFTVQPVVSQYISPVTKNIYKTFFRYFSLRAPPVC